MTKELMMIRFAPALFAALLLASPTFAQSVPFRGTFAGKTLSAVPTDDPNVLLVTTGGGGHATHLGNYTMVSPHLAYLLTGEVVGQQVFTAANGDLLYADITGQFLPTKDGLLVAQIEGIITGGTGRFRNAGGQYVFDIVFDPATFMSEATISGAISHHGP